MAGRDTGVQRGEQPPRHDNRPLSPGPHRTEVYWRTEEDKERTPLPILARSSDNSTELFTLDCFQDVTSWPDKMVISGTHYTVKMIIPSSKSKPSTNKAPIAGGIYRNRQLTFESLPHTRDNANISPVARGHYVQCVPRDKLYL
ncbi:unnamed protein product [Nezara viridula]|uniref:Uncharacterized protein n=1 Tax=Nezara viridula TaxID=85310 RepID=A0A9P0HDX7_NEZVI|nr:unnamed protein product [Nezara viridula]